MADSTIDQVEYQRGFEDGSNAIAALMSAIVHADVKPHVYDVTLKRSDYSSGFDAYIQFRTGEPGMVSGLSAHDDNALAALQKLHDELIAAFGKCPHCGSYRHKTQNA